MSEAPERITAWLSKDGSTRFEGGRLFPAGVEVEYIRADRIEELEAKLAKAVECLSFYGALIGGKHENPWHVYSEDFGKKARTTIAELTGGNDE